MSNKDKLLLQVLRSADVLTGGSSEISKQFDGVHYPKLPSADSLAFGEIALNIAKGYEVIAIKNDNGDIIYLPFNVAIRLLTAETSLNELSGYTISSIEILSATTINLYNTIDDLRDELINKINDDIMQLSGSSFSAITMIQDEIDSLKLSDLSDVDVVSHVLNPNQIDVLSKSGNIWTNRVIGVTSKEEYGMMKVGDGLEVTNGVVSAQKLEVDTELISGSENPVAGGAVYDSVHSLSGSSFSAITMIQDEIDSLKLSELSDVDVVSHVVNPNQIDVLTKNGNVWTNRVIGVTSKEEYGMMKVGDGLEVTNGVVSAQKLDVDTELISGSENPVAGGAVYDSVHTLSGYTDSLSAETLELNELIERVYEDYHEFSGKTSAEIDELSGSSISAYTSIYNDIEEDELVTAGAFAKINHSLGFNKNGEYIPESEALNSMSVTEAIDYLCENYEDISHKSGSGVTIVSVKYEVLHSLYIKRKLIPGVFYRITNYQATVNSPSFTTRIPVVDSGFMTSMGFDIIVFAMSESTLSENAFAIRSVGDSYFNGSSVESWRLKYSLLNDGRRFSWANPNGFGVIYYMRDEYGNEAHYDFKNIKNVHEGSSLFTFCHYADDSDLSLTGKASDNVINAAYAYSTLDKSVMMLNNISLIGGEERGNIFAVGCHDIKMNGDMFDNRIAVSMSMRDFTGNMNCMLIGYRTL